MPGLDRHYRPDDVELIQAKKSPTYNYITFLSDNLKQIDLKVYIFKHTKLMEYCSQEDSVYCFKQAIIGKSFEFIPFEGVLD